jgi:membrane protease YdiL (CAAX protease family)
VVDNPLITGPPGPSGDGSARPIANDAPVFRRVPWRLTDVVVGIAVILLFQGAVWFEAVQRALADNPLYWVAYFGPLVAWIGIYPLWVARRRTSLWLVRMPRLGKLIKESLIAVPLAFALLLTLGLLILLVQHFIGHRLMTHRVFENAPSDALPRMLVYAILGTTIGPLVEEIFFRGFAYNALRARVGVFAALIAQAGLFAFVHPVEIAHRGAVFLIGIVLATVYDWRKTLATPVVMHGTYNAIVLAIAFAAFWTAPFLGVNGSSCDRGCQITKVYDGSAAEKAGLRPQDIIVSLDGESARTMEDLTKLVRDHKAGDTVEIEIVRDGRELSKSAVLQRRVTHDQ